MATATTPLTATESTVARATRAGVAQAQRVYLPAAITRVVVPLVVVVALAWFMATSTAGGAMARVGVAAAVVIGAVGLVRAVFDVARIRRTNAVIDSLPTDGSIGPGEVRSRIYSATWEVDQLQGLAVLAVFVVGIVVVARSASISGLFDSTSPGVRLALALGLVALVVVVVVDVRQLLTSRAVASGRLTPASTARRRGTTSRRVVAGDLAGVGATVDVGQERVLCWSAPVMRVGAEGDRVGVVGWSVAGGVQHDDWAQNTVVVTDQALYLLCAIPSSQAAVLADESYGQVKMALFYTGTEIRGEAANLLQSGMATAFATDPRNIRIARDQLTTLDMADANVGIALTLASGEVQAYIFNHADAAAGFAQQASATWLPLRRSPARHTPALDPAGVTASGRIVIRLAAGFMALIAVVLLLLSGVGLASSLGQSRMTGRSTGTVTEVAKLPAALPSSSAQIVDCAARAEFTVEGRAYTTPTSSTPDNCRLVVGRSTPVAYDPGDPNRSMLGEPPTASLPITALAVLASLGLLVGALLLAFRARRLIPDRPCSAAGSNPQAAA
jgi:hypothetical protein